MKKHSILIKTLIIITFFVPIVIFALSKFVDENTLKELYEHTFERLGISQKTTISNSIANKKFGDSEHFSIGETGDYTWGSFEEVYEHWDNPYTVTQDQYGYDSPLVGYCCYLGWPTIKSADSSYMSDLDEAGGDHAYPSWAAYAGRLALANHNGHKLRIECEQEATFGNLNKAIAYAESGLNEKYSNGDIQNLVWNSAVWQNYFQNSPGVIDAGVVEGNLGSATQIDTIGNVSYHYQGDSVPSRLVRAQQFATWAYQVLANDGYLDLKLTPAKKNENEVDESKKLHVEVDQATLSYLVGPFQLDLIPSEGGNVINNNITAAGTGNQTLGDFLYKEMTMQNATQTSANTFIKTRFIIHAEYTDGTLEDVEVKRNADGTIAKQEESAKTAQRVVITDEQGVALEYGMPEFGKEFYIKYYLTDDLAKNHNLKYIQPEIKAEYLNDAMTAGGIKEKSIKVSYSIHYSLCNTENDAVNSYVKKAGYENMDLGDSPTGSSLLEAFFYSNDKGKTANVQEGIDALVDMVAHSNQGGEATVTWYDDSWGGWDDVEQLYADYWGYDRKGRCDGVFLDECDTTIYHGGSISSAHDNFSFASEFDTLDAYWECLKSNYKMFVSARSDEGGSGNGDIIKYYAEKMAASTNNGEEFSADWIRSPEKFSSTNCGCDENETCPGENDSCCGNDACKTCDCYEPAEYCDCDDGEDSSCDCDPCDCYEPEVKCSCGCSCKYKYTGVQLFLASTTYYRDYVGGNTQQAIKIIKGDEDLDTVTIPESEFTYETADDAVEALVGKINDEIKKVLEKREKELHDWFYAHAWPALYVPYGIESWPYTLPFVEEKQEKMQKVIYNIHAERSSSWVGSDYVLTKKEINEYLGGNVSENQQGIPSNAGVQKDDVWQGSGVEVTLIDLGVQLAEPTPPTPPIPPDEIPEVPPPVNPGDPPPEPTRESQYTPPKESPPQSGHQCAIFAAVNELQVMGYDVDPNEAVQWMVDRGYYGADDSGPYPSRYQCVEYMRDYISKHENTKCTVDPNDVDAFFDNDYGGGWYLNESYLREHLPENVNGQTQYQPDKKYSAFQVSYFGSNPGINNSQSHYVTFSEYRTNPDTGKFEVYVLNSGKSWSSQWLEWDSINDVYWKNNGVGQGSLGEMNPNNPHDAGIIESKYMPKFVNNGEGTEWESMSEEDFQKAHDEWEKEYAKWEEAKKEYDKALEAYNNYQAATGEGSDNAKAWAAYNKALSQYEKDLATYNSDVAAWNGGVQEPKVVQVTVTDENGNYGFQRLNPLHTYTVQFRYDGLEYIAELGNPTSDGETTEIADDIQKRISAYEIDIYNEQAYADDPRKVLQGREEVNDNFENIDASNNNYSGNHGTNKAYGWFTKLRGNGAEFYSHSAELEPNGGLDNNTNAMRFVDAYHEFKKLAVEKRKVFDQSSIVGMYNSYDDIEKTGDITYDSLLGELPGRLGNANTSLTEGNDNHDNSLDTYNEAEHVRNFINDSLVVAKTKLKFPDEKPVKFFLEDVGSGNNEDENNKKDGNSDSHNNYSHTVCDDPFPVKVGTSPRAINALYNKKNSGDALTIRNRDQARNIDYSYQRREEANLAIAMDLEAVTLLINGQKEVYEYGDLGLNENNVEDFAKVSNRVSNEFQNYKKNYSRIITESMYLYDGKIVDNSGGEVNPRDLSMFITYKIVIKNTSESVNMDVGYIVDHFDAFYLKWDPNDQYRVRSIVDNPEYYTAEVTVNDNQGGSHPYAADKNSLSAGGIPNMYNEVFISVGSLGPQKSKTLTITFEQTKDKYGRLNINQNLESGALLVGDKNVVEIDGYSTSNNDIFHRGLITRQSNIGNLCPVDFYGAGNKAGSLKDDVDDHTQNRVEIDTANAPNLIIYIPPKGFIPCISGYTFEDVRNHTNNNAVIGNGKFNTSDQDKKGTGDKDKKIAGVTVELVEFVRQVDQNGLTSGTNDSYIKEKIWGSITFPMDGSGSDQRVQPVSQINIPHSYQASYENHNRYYSGSGSSQIMMDVESGYLKVSSRQDENGGSYTNIGEGEYKFVNVPPGNFVVRFIYGDTTQTVLTNDSTNEVNNLLATKSTIPLGNVTGDINYENPKDDNYMFLNDGSDGYVGNEGLNVKSYNGNDFKSTIYQLNLDQSTSYEGINGYNDFERQNFTNNDGISMTQVKDSDLLAKLYYYDIKTGDSANDVSDAKDIYAFRQNSDNYAKGYISSLTGNLKQDHYNAQLETYKISHSSTYDPETFIPRFEPDALGNGDLVGENPITLRNYRNEIMNSFEQIGTYTSSNSRPTKVSDNDSRLDANRQVEMLKELMKYTRMVAQTGIINFEVEYTEEDWAGKYHSDKEYVTQDQINSAPTGPSDAYIKGDRTKHYHIRDLNLGLVQRPEAQIRLNKNASNIKISLSSGETLFDTSKSVNNLYFAIHKAHTYKINSKRLQSVNVTTNSLTSPELIQAYMDDELIENATLQVKYIYTIENIGEVDYLDKKFYYKGEEDEPSNIRNVSRTNVDEVLDYVPNSINFEANISNSMDELRVKNVNDTMLNSGYEKSKWNVKAIIPEGGTAGQIRDSKEYYSNYIYPFGVQEIDAQREQTPVGGTTPGTLSNNYLWGSPNASNLNADLVNREFFDRVITYDTIITTDRLSTKKYNNDNYCSIQHNGGEAYTFGLLPKAYDTDKVEYYKIETPVVLSVVMSESEDLVFPNLVEAVRISNSVGRRTTYSTVGNQPMANQHSGIDVPSEESKDKLNDKYSTYSPVDVVTPVEVDADSSQNVRILPPTGFNKNNSNLYFALIGAFSIIIVSIFMIKVGYGQRRAKKNSDISRWM